MPTIPVIKVGGSKTTETIAKSASRRLSHRCPARVERVLQGMRPLLKRHEIGRDAVGPTRQLNPQSIAGYLLDGGGTFANSRPRPSAMVRCAITASRTL